MLKQHIKNESINDAETSTSFDKNMTKGEVLY